jgi:hypothetical protein
LLDSVVCIAIFQGRRMLLKKSVEIADFEALFRRATPLRSGCGPFLRLKAIR